MKNMDPKSIVDRSLKRLATKPAYKHLRKDGSIVQYTEEQGEMLGETARYGEFLQREMKWDTSRGFASVKHMARLVGKKLDRKRSACGTIICTHTTKSINGSLGEDRLSNLGKTILDINEESNWDSGTEVITDDDTSKALVPWWSPTSGYSIPVGAYGRNGKGFPYIVAQTKAIKYWNKDWNIIKRTSDSLKDFYSKGGWDGYKYVTIPVVQGELQTALLGKSDNTACQVFLLDTLDIEAADRYYTKQFIYAEIKTLEGEIEKWEETPALTKCNSTDCKFEVQILDDLSGTAIMFGDGINGAIPPEGATITLHYLKTAGSEGNTQEPFSFKPDVSGANIDSTLNLVIGFQNPWPILGGTDLEKVAEFKKSAETAYANMYKTIHTVPEFLERLNTLSPIYLMKYKVHTGLDKQIVDNLTIYANKVFVTGLTTNLDKLSATEQGLFNSVINKNMNDGSIFEMSVMYKEPNIIKINSNIEIEPATHVNDVEALAEELSNYLYNSYGPYITENMDKYQQITLVKGLLDYYENVASENSLDMIELDQSNWFVDSKDNVIQVEWSLPKASMNNYGKDNTCILNESDGFAYPYVIQIGLKKSNTTLLSGNGVIKCLKTSKYTFSNADLRGQNVLPVVEDDTENSWSKCTLTVEASTENLNATLKIPKTLICNKLGIEEDNLEKELHKSVSGGTIKFNLNFIPADKTISFDDWNSILYYNNIDVTIKQ